MDFGEFRHQLGYRAVTHCLTPGLDCEHSAGCLASPHDDATWSRSWRFKLLAIRLIAGLSSYGRKKVENPLLRKGLSDRPMYYIRLRAQQAEPGFAPSASVAHGRWYTSTSVDRPLFPDRGPNPVADWGVGLGDRGGHPLVEGGDRRSPNSLDHLALNALEAVLQLAQTHQFALPVSFGRATRPGSTKNPQWLADPDRSPGHRGRVSRPHL